MKLLGRAARQEYVARFQGLIQRYPLVGIAGARGVPASQLHQLRIQLGPETKIRFCRNKLLKLALQNAELGSLCDYLQDQVVLVCSKLPGFKLFKLLESSKQSYPLKPGAVAPQDIYVEPGPTGLKPGPIVGELQVLGIPAAVEKGRVVIRERKLVLKQGQKVSSSLAAALSALDIKPLNIGLELRAVIEDGCLLTRQQLALDPAQIASELAQGIQHGLNLAVGIGYPHPSILPKLIQRSYQQALMLGLSLSLYYPELVPQLILKALKIACSLGITDMECVYAALLLYQLRKPITEQNLLTIFESIGAQVDRARIKMLVSALEEVNIAELIKQQTGALMQAPGPMPTPAPAQEKPPEKQEKKEERKKEEKPPEETGLAGLEALFE